MMRFLKSVKFRITFYFAATFAAASLLCFLIVVFHQYRVQRSEHRQRLYRILRHRETFERLRRDLPQTLARDHCPASALLCDALGDHDHDAAHYRDHIVGTALFVDRKLNVGERHDIEVDRTGIAGQNMREINDFLLCLLTRVGEGMVVDRLDPHTPSRHAIACDRRIKTARQQQHPAARAADGHALRTVLYRREDIRKAVFANIDLDVELWMRQVDFVFGAPLEHISAEIGAYLRGILLQRLVRTVDGDAEGRFTRRRERHHRLADRIIVGAHFERLAERVKSEHPFQAFFELLCLALVEVLDIVAVVRFGERVAHAAERRFYVFDEQLFEIAAILAFEKDLSKT